MFSPTFGVPAGLALWILYQYLNTPRREDPAKKLMERLDDIKEIQVDIQRIQIDHGNRLTRVEAIMDERGRK